MTKRVRFGAILVRLVACLLLPAGLLFAAVPSARAESWDMPTPYPDKTFHTVNISEFASDVAAATDGALTIAVHSAGSLIKHPEIKNAVRSRIVPIGEFILSRLSNESPIYAVDSLPFLATTYEDARALWGAQRPFVEQLLAQQGLMPLFAVPWPPQGLYTQSSIETVDDLRGVKFRAYNATMEQLADLLGAAPTQVEVPDIPQAFATGRVEAMMTSPSTGANAQAWDFVGHFYNVRAWLPKNIVVVNKRVFDRLPQTVQAAVLGAADTAQERGWRMSMAETEEKIAILRDNGMQVHEPSAELMAGFKKVGDAMLQDWLNEAGRAGADLVAAYEE